MDLKNEILSNPFLDRLRNELVLDRGAYLSLCSLLERLAKEWHTETFIDKQLVQELYALPTIVKGVADAIAVQRSDFAAELEQIAITLDGLILECLT